MGVILTIAIPTYNIQEYIVRCLNSFSNIKEEYKKNIEILVINDGSTDLSKEVIENYIEKEKVENIKLINKYNGGHGSTINTAIKNANGKYFKVIDGDDWIDSEELNKLIYYLKNNDVDMVVTDYTEHHTYNGTIKLINIFNYSEKTLMEKPEKRIPMHAITYRTNILKDNEIYLSEGIFYVDIQYSIFPMKYVKNWTYIKLNVYQYFLGRPEQSMNFSNIIKNRSHHLEVLKSLLMFKEDNTKLDLNTLKSIDDTIKYMIKVQLISEHYEREYNLINVMEKYRLSYKKNISIFYLIYLNMKTKRFFSLFLDIIINKKLKKVRQDIFYES